MAARASNHRGVLSPARLKVRSELASDFSKSLEEARTSKRASARHLVISDKTARNWASGATALSLETLLMFKPLGLRFIRRVCERLVHRTAPYLASRNASRRKGARKGAR